MRAFVLGALAGVACIACVAAQVTFEASVPTTVNGQQTQGIVVSCSSVDGQSVVDTTTIDVTLTNGAVVPVKVDCRSPVYMFDLLPAGSVPQRVMSSTLPLCDAPVNGFTGEKIVRNPQRRRLMRILAASTHLGHGKHRNLGTSIFRDWTAKDWRDYANGDAHLVRDLGLGPQVAAELQANTTHLHRLYAMYDSSPAIMKRGLDVILGTNRAMFPPFMRNPDGTIRQDWYHKVVHGSEWVADAQTHPQQRRALFEVIGSIALGIAAANNNFIHEKLVPVIEDIQGQLVGVASALDANARSINATLDFATVTRNMLNDTANALESAEAAIEGLQVVTEINTQGIADNKDSIIANAELMDQGFTQAFKEREELRTEMESITAEAQILAEDMTAEVNALRAFTVNTIDTVMKEIAKADKRTADVSRQLMDDVFKATKEAQALSLVVYQQSTQQQVRRQLTKFFYDINAAVTQAGWKPFLWQDTGAPSDQTRIGQEPTPEDWLPGSVHRSIELDTIQVLFVEAGEQGAGGVGTINHKLHEHTFKFVCDAAQLMDDVAPWFTYKDIASFMGPGECLPIPPGTVGGVPTPSPDASRGEWTTTVAGDPKTNAEGQPVKGCTCWVEFTARTCTHGETTAGTNPFDRPGFDTTASIGTQGLDSPHLCVGTGASSPVDDTAVYAELQSAGMNTYTIADVLTSSTDPGRQWYHANQRYLRDWTSFVSLTEWGCGHERFVPFVGNPTVLGYKRTKWLADGSAYALVTSGRMSNLYQDANGDTIPFVMKIKSFADADVCAEQNVLGNACYDQPRRANCGGCQACGASPVSLSQMPSGDDQANRPTPPTNLGQAVFKVLEKAWVGMVNGLADMEVTMFGVMPADVELTTSEFSYSPEAKTSYKCRYLTSIYTLGGTEPLQTQQLRSVHKYMSVRMDPWGNTGTSSNPDSWIKTPSGAIALNNVWEQTTSDPGLFNDATVFLESNMVWAGSKDCMVNECTSPDVFLANAGARLPTEQTRYTYNVPQGLLSTSPDTAARIGSPTYIMSPKTPEQLGPDGITLNEWVATNNGNPFDPLSASASLHHYYMPLVKDGNNLHCENSLTAAMGPICGLLDNYVVYTPTSDEYGDPDITTECNKPDVLCFRPKRFKYRQQFVVPQGTTSQSFVTACPTLDTSPTLKGIPTLYLSHATSSVVQARVVMSGTECLSATVPVAIPPAKRVAVSVQVCDDLTIVVERFNAATGEWVDCGNEETIDVKPPEEFGGDAANITYVQPVTYVQSIDNQKLIDVGTQQNKVMGDMRNMVMAMAHKVYGTDSDALASLKADAPSVFNFTAFSSINKRLHEQGSAAADAENQRVAAAQGRIDNLKTDAGAFDAKAKAAADAVNASVVDLKKDVTQVKALVPRMNDVVAQMNETGQETMRISRDVASNIRASAETNQKLLDQGLDISDLGDKVEDAVEAAADVVEKTADLATDALSSVGKVFDAIGGLFGGGLMGTLFTLMLPCILGIVVLCVFGIVLYFCCGDRIKAGVVAVGPAAAAAGAGAIGGPMAASVAYQFANSLTQQQQQQQQQPKQAAPSPTNARAVVPMHEEEAWPQVAAHAVKVAMDTDEQTVYAETDGLLHGP